MKKTNKFLTKKSFQHLKLVHSLIQYRFNKSEILRKKIIDIKKKDFFDENIFIRILIRHRLTVFLKDEFLLRELLTKNYSIIKNHAKKEIHASLRLKNLTLEISELFDKYNTLMLVIKGIPLSIQTTGNSFNRGSGDLDILVKQNEVRKSIKLLNLLGFTPIKGEFVLDQGFWLDYCKFVDNEIKLFRKSKLGIEIIDLHWSLTTFKRSTKNFENLWENRAIINLNNVLVNTLDIDNCFIYICAHNAIDRWSSLRNFVDIYYLYEKISHSIHSKIINRKLFEPTLFIFYKIFNYEINKENFIKNNKRLIPYYKDSLIHQSLPYKNFGYLNWSLKNTFLYFLKMILKTNHILDIWSFLLKSCFPPKSITRKNSFSSKNIINILIDRFKHFQNKLNVKI